MNQSNIERRLLAQIPDLPEGAATELIPMARTVLGNLVHYKHGGSHEETDIAWLAGIIWDLLQRRTITLPRIPGQENNA